MARKKLNEGKVKKLIDLSPDTVKAIEDKANEQGLTFKYYAQNILEQAAKKLSRNPGQTFDTMGRAKEVNNGYFDQQKA